MMMAGRHCRIRSISRTSRDFLTSSVKRIFGCGKSIRLRRLQNGPIIPSLQMLHFVILTAMRQREDVSKVAGRASSGVNPECWVDDHGDCLYRYALLRVRRPEVAEDLVQETLCARVGDVFMLREMEEMETAQICQAMRISQNNLWVMLHRARMALRECLELNWFENEPKLKTDG